MLRSRVATIKELDYVWRLGSHRKLVDLQGNHFTFLAFDFFGVDLFTEKFIGIRALTKDVLSTILAFDFFCVDCITEKFS